MAVTKTEDGQEYPASAYLYVPDPEKPSTWKLRFKEYVDGELKTTPAQLGRAAAALSPGGFRGNRVDLPPDEARQVKRKLVQLYREFGLEPPGHLTESADEAISDLTPLIEAKVDVEGKQARVTLIRAGWSTNGRYYSQDTLRRAASLFEGAKAYSDHPTASEERERPERSIRDLVGWYSNSRFENGTITADLHVLESAGWLRSILREAPHLVALSINALGKVTEGVAEGRKGRIVESIHKVRSVDLVTEAAAGGRIERLIASERSEGGDGEVNMQELTVEALREARPDLVEAIFAEARAKAKEEAEKDLAGLRESVERLEKEAARERQRNAVAEALRASGLPEAAQVRVRRIVEARLPFEDEAKLREAVEQAVKEERDYLAQVAPAGVRGMGQAAEQVKESISRVEQKLARLFGIREGDR